MILFDKVTIIGVGLIGGSLARVLKEQGLAREITGAGRSREALELGQRLGVIDSIGREPKSAVEGADLVVLASPVGAFEATVQEIAPRLKQGAILTDVGSVKGALARNIEALLPPGVFYVPGHPIAGKEKFGVAEATASLFQGAKCILTPTEKTDAHALAVIRQVWEAAGATVLMLDPDLHDRIFGAVSHLPHVAAFAMMCTVAELTTGTEDFIDYSGAGFRDFTRIAGSSPEIWKDICLMNRKNLIEMIDRYQFALNLFKQELTAGDAGRLEKHLRLASDTRRGLD